MVVLTFGHVNVTNRSKDRKFCNFFRPPKSNNDIESRQLITPLPNAASSCLFLDFGVELVYVDVFSLVPPAILSHVEHVNTGSCFRLSLFGSSISTKKASDLEKIGTKTCSLDNGKMLLQIDHFACKIFN